MVPSTVKRFQYVKTLVQQKSSLVVSVHTCTWYRYWYTAMVRLYYNLKHNYHFRRKLLTAPATRLPAESGTGLTAALLAEPGNGDG